MITIFFFFFELVKYDQMLCIRSGPSVLIYKRGKYDFILIAYVNITYYTSIRPRQVYRIFFIPLRDLIPFNKYFEIIILRGPLTKVDVIFFFVFSFSRKRKFIVVLSFQCVFNERTYYDEVLQNDFRIRRKTIIEVYKSGTRLVVFFFLYKIIFCFLKTSRSNFMFQ